MFRKKKSSTPAESPAVMRGRGAAGQGTTPSSKGKDNPLARRFRAESEPATIDLVGPAGFPADAVGDADPKTEALQTDVAKLSRVISHDPASGKFYIHPGSVDLPVSLQGEPVLAPTELRRGDMIRVGSLEIRFGP